MSSIDWKDKIVVVTGSEGMIGKELVILLKELEAKVFEVDKKKGLDIANRATAYSVCVDADYVFHLAGVKGNPKMTNERPADFMIPMLMMDTNMIWAANECKVKKMLYTSSIAVENTESDKYPAWAKQTAETLIEAMRVQYQNEKSTDYCIVRPANVFGRFDDFNNPTAMVVTSLISKALKDKKLVMDIKGSEQVRDFISAKDVAKGMIKVMEGEAITPINLCAGKGTLIKGLGKLIAKELDVPIELKELNLTLGPDKKVMQRNYDIEVSPVEEGIKEVIEWQKKK